jgi:tetratricopeptide (TPR) repeat protein
MLAPSWFVTRVRVDRTRSLGSHKFSRFGACLLTGLACACRSAATDTTDVAVQASSSGARDENVNGSGASEAHALCLAEPGQRSRQQRLERSLRVARTRAAEPFVWSDAGEAWLALAESSGDPGFTLNADACADVALSIDAEHASALGVRARVLLTRHEFKAARTLAERILGAVPDDLSALRTLSDAALELGDVEGCERAVQRLMDLEPNLAAYSRAAYLRWLHGQVPQALELMRLAIDAAGDPSAKDARAWALTQAALMFWHQGDYEGADAGFGMALAVRGDHAPALVGRARVALARADYGSASELLERALELQPEIETARLLAELRALVGDGAGAAARNAEAERLGRSDRRGLSLFYSTRHMEAERALALANEELADRGDIYTEDALAWALHESRQHELAEQHIERALRHGTPDARLLYHAGAIAIGAGKHARGRALLRRALALNPHFGLEAASDARRLLGDAT